MPRIVPSSVLMRRGPQLLKVFEEAVEGIEQICGFEFVKFRGGFAVQGQTAATNSPVRGIFLSPFWILRHPLTEAQHLAEMGRQACPLSQLEYPATMMNHAGALAVIERVKPRFQAAGFEVGLPTEAERQAAAAGGLVSLRRQMKIEDVETSSVLEWMKDRFQHPVTEECGLIMTHPTPDEAGAFMALLTQSSKPIAVTRVHATPDGRRHLHQMHVYKKELAIAAEEAPENAARVRGMAGPTQDWLEDLYHPASYLLTSAVDPLNTTPWSGGAEEGLFRCTSGPSWMTEIVEHMRIQHRNYIDETLEMPVIGLRFKLHRIKTGRSTIAVPRSLPLPSPPNVPYVDLRALQRHFRILFVGGLRVFRRTVL